MRFNERVGGNNRIHPLADTHELEYITLIGSDVYTRDYLYYLTYI